ncbi:MAG: serine/threonine protein kinase, partial [Planctomycetaceae bacterium]|nr:serine/threonine protein kinase [Planctomycetaceae bacterium]
MSRHIMFAIALITITSSTLAEDWPQFRGPNCAGISQSKASLPIEFDSEKNVRWKAALGDGIGCPVVAAGRVFTSAMIGDTHIALYAFDAATGDQLWMRKWPAGDLANVHKTNSHASTTPAADAKHCYFYFSTLGMVAVDATTGKDVWHKELPTPYFVFKWGPGMSPTLYKDKLLFVQDDDLYPAFYAFNKKTGDIVWKDDRSDQACNYTHPVICKTSKGDEIVVGGTGMLIGYDPDNGKRLWHARTLLRNMKTTPVSLNGVVYISLQSGGIANQWLASVDQADTGNSDGKLTKEEVQAFIGDRPVPEAFFKKTFGRGDLNKDGALEGKELDLAFLHPDNFAGANYENIGEKAADEYVMAVKAGGRGDVTKTHLLWKHRTKYTDHIVSPIVVNERMLLIKGGGVATCFDIKGGKQLFGPARIDNASEYFASPIYGDGKIYVAAENGNVVVLKNSDKVEVLAVNDLCDGVLGTPAIADGSLFIRTRKSLL